MKHTTFMYTFTKDGKSYSATAKNRFEAQDKIELAFGIDLDGATFKEIYKLRTLRTGIVRPDMTIINIILETRKEIAERQKLLSDLGYKCVSAVSNDCEEYIEMVNENERKMFRFHRG